VRCTASRVVSAVGVSNRRMGLVTLVAVVSETDADTSRLIDSLHHQTDRGWELVVVDTTGGPALRVRRRGSRSRIRRLDRPGADVATAAADGLGEAPGDLVGFVGPSDELEATAIATMARRAGADVDLVYSDEDRITADGERADPLYKPGWSPDRLRCQPYTGRLTLLRRELVDRIGGVDVEAAEAYEWDLVLRAGERARRVEHVAEILCHRRLSSDGIDRGSEAERHVIETHLDRTGFPAIVERSNDPPAWRLRPALRDEPLVTIVIPTAGRSRMVHGSPMKLISNCVEQIVEHSTYRNYEIVCVAGDELDDGTRASLRSLAGDRLRFAANAGAFNFSAAINVGALHAKGEYLLLLNDDTEVITPDWIEAMVMYGQDPGVGAVGAKLLFADGRLQHGGIIAPWRGVVGHPCYGFPGDWTGHANHLVLPANYLAVTGACLLTRRDRFEEAGGFATLFPLNYNDVDYCLKLHHQGYRVVFNPDARLYHFELSSRISATVEQDELDALIGRWGDVADPFYNPSFLPSTDFMPPVRSAADIRRTVAATP
jgi:glycosyltransferase involved in cell wall biosynthesis